ncbi:beta-propeller domain-containing protein [Brevibacillus migulae]|uniref:beta-propeller domain-containing protein n=1 Tax=Brevibacillus migulae TaxID=1644114 RepID=UPI00106EFEAE|nr:beta-propeller domain-containing protein [Brevibacillus migulae]
MKKHMKKLLLACTGMAVLTPLLLMAAPTWFPDKEVRAASADELPVVGSYSKLKELLKDEMENREYRYGYRKGIIEAPAAVAEMAAAPASSQAKQVSGQADYSTTNIQVAGVDEADVVKTDGSYIYQATEEALVITQAMPANQMKVIKRLDYRNQRFFPSELYVDDRHLVVIGTHNPAQLYYDSAEIGHRIAGTTKAFIYDISNPSSLEQVREVEIEGNYLTSRKIGSSLYLVSNRGLDLYGIMEAKSELLPPLYRDSLADKTYMPVPYNQIHYFPDQVEPNYLIVAGLNLDKPQQKMDVAPYLGSGENVYASSENLYVAVTKNPPAPGLIKRMIPTDTPVKQDTSIYKFSLKNGHLSYERSGQVPGTTLNQFSMDEHNGYLRIATTSGDMWRNDEHTSKNNLYVLDQHMQAVGKLEGIAPGEKIYSARFMGDRAYMVTFRKVDPLFVIDLKDPAAPTILGKLKIPGYSDYLHPYDENHIIGFGKDTEETKDMAFYQGLKVALFDITDVAHPKEKFVEIIGDRGTDSELLRNHKALLFSKEKNLLAFPVNLMERADKNNADIMEYGQFTFQGAYIYQLDLNKGFTLRKRITHLDDADAVKAGDAWYESKKNVSRILYIKDTLYTISEEKIKAHDFQKLNEINTVRLPAK